MHIHIHLLIITATFFFCALGINVFQILCKMDSGTASLSMTQDNYLSVQHKMNNNNFTLFDTNLQKINEKLKFVNQYYIPKYEQPVENHLNVRESKELSKTFDEEIDQSLNFFNEFYKLTMNEIESIRKTDVRNILNKKAMFWEHKRKECSINTKNKDAEFTSKIRETLIIDRNYAKKLLVSNDDKFQTELYEERMKLDQKKRNLKFTIALKVALSSLSNVQTLMVEKLKSNHKSKLFDDQMNIYMLFEADLNKLKNVFQKSDDKDLLALNQLTQNIQHFNQQLIEYISENSESKNISMTDDHKEENREWEKMTPQNAFQETNNELQNFSFKVDKNPEVKSDDYFTFKFKENKEKTDDISNFSFVIENEKHELKNEVMSTKLYNFENEYRKFLENYLSCQKHLKRVEHLYSAFLQDSSFKQLRQELTKSINTPVNSISSVSSWHMKDKFEKLDSLLKCKTVKTGNSTVSANCHKDALLFCKDTLAKKFINIGEQVASVKAETAFEVASIITELWQIHPDFGVLLYSRFKQKCPCLIPYNAAKTKEETDEEYYKSLGYNYIDGVVETQDKYVKRMTGIIRLFASIIVTETKSGCALGIGQAWMIIATTVSLVPQLDITAILLHEMLVITGYNMKKAYGKQFIKMLQYIDSNYMNKIDEVTPIGCGGPVQRLKTYISKTIQTGYIDRPKGIIPYNFW